ncbi:glycosyltransferase [Roseibium sp. RKSG952]|uniref:glycosyltransferase n=1 Tax=Roseibium sp. RKSG952 TaxID=2529384 RepID=UPI0012BBD560|nr:glycosyltransferase [Roseibium sp. RKSG952]MTH95123.1 glycosyltransferase [Roseibium sp. RKSG952]
MSNIQGNKRAFEVFSDHIHLKRIENKNEESFDIRDYIISNFTDTWNIGYVSQNLKSAYAANLGKTFTDLIPADSERLGASDKFLISGTIHSDAEISHKGAVRALQHYKPGQTLILFEQGFLASTHSWSEAFRQENPKHACLGYVYDDIAHYFMADYPNRLIQKLNSSFSLSEAEQGRASVLIDRIVSRKISKYNSQPIYSPAMTGGFQRRVLICDQAFADASTVYGKVDENDFEAMLIAALRENPDAEILVKTHPDTFWEKGKRTGYYNHLKDTGRIRVFREPINPYCLLELVDKVYVGTSQLGLEALLAGKEVVCFGVPFYAGWGLTDDRQAIPHRHRTRSLEEVFHIFYIWYTIYHVPGCAAPSRIEDVLDYIESERPVTLPPSSQELEAAPKVSVILPVYGVEKYIEQCLTSIQRQTLREIEIIPVNDKSPDGSQAIIDRLAAEDPRIKPIILPENIGQGFARNAGIKRATGKYIFFIDSDDFFASTNVLQLCYNEAEECTADLVRVQKEIIFEGDSIELARLDSSERNFADKKKYSDIDKQPEILKSWHCWLFLYRRKLLNKNNIEFLTPQWEERAFVLRAMEAANAIITLPVPGVVYRKRKQSTVHRNRTEKDLLLMCANIEASGRLFKGTMLSSFIGLQFAKAMITGAWKSAISVAISKKKNEQILDKLSSAFSLFDVSISSHKDIPQVLLEELPNIERLILIATAFSNRDWVLAAKIIDETPIDQEYLLSLFLSKPEDDKKRNLQEALSLYARNKRVNPARKVVFKSKKPRILIHIGSTKTGSTYLQHFFEQNRAALLRNGVWFPEVGLFWQKDRPHKQAGHAAFVSAAVRDEQHLKQYLETGLSLAGGRIHTIILSSEAYFLNRKSVQLADYFAGYPIQMIGYFRRQDVWANSQYCEFVGGGAIGKVDIPIGEWLESPITRERLSYKSYIDLWAAKIGRENIIVRPYEKMQFKDNDLLSDFCQAAGIFDYQSLPRPNTRQRNDFPLGKCHIELMRSFNRMPFPDKDHYLRFVEAVTQGLAGKGARPDMLTRDQKEKLLEAYQAENAEIASIYLDRKDGQLFMDLSLSAEAETADPGIPVEDVQLFFDCYRRFSEKPRQPEAPGKKSAPKSTDLRQKVAKSRYAQVNFIPIKNEWSLYKQVRVTFKNIMLRRPTYFESSILRRASDASSRSAPNCSPLELANRFGPIKNSWPRMKKYRVLVKNISLGRPIFYE